MPCDVDWDRIQRQYQHQPPAQQIIVAAPPSSVLLKGKVCINTHGTGYAFVDETVLKMRSLKPDSTMINGADVRTLEEAIISGDLDFMHEVLTEMYEEHRVPEIGWADASVELTCAKVSHDLESAGIRMQFWRTKTSIEVTLGWTQTQDMILSVSSKADSWAHVQVFDEAPLCKQKDNPYIVARGLKEVAIKTVNARKALI